MHSPVMVLDESRLPKKIDNVAAMLSFKTQCLSRKMC